MLEIIFLINFGSQILNEIKYISKITIVDYKISKNLPPVSAFVFTNLKINGLKIVYKIIKLNNSKLVTVLYGF